MATQIIILGKPVKVELSPAAMDALRRDKLSLLAEMELYFSCLIRKQVRFYEGDNIPDGEHFSVNEQLSVSFRPVMTQSCSVESTGSGGPPVTDFPITNPAAYVPHWLRLDFRKGEWWGEFGYK